MNMNIWNDNEAEITEIEEMYVPIWLPLILSSNIIMLFIQLFLSYFAFILWILWLKN